MITQYRGYALITVLLFLEIFALLGFYALETNIWESHLADQYWQRLKITNAADYLLFSLEGHMEEKLAECPISLLATRDFKNQSLDWWREVSCTGNFQLFQYYYVVESLSAHSCSYIDQENKDSFKKPNAAFMRLTLLVINPQNTNDKVMLQSMMAIPDTSENHCRGRRRKVFAGRQSFRQLI